MRALVQYVLKPITLIGALNWGLVGLFKFNLVEWLFGPMSITSRAIYVAVGIAAVVWILLWIFGTRSCACHIEHHN